MLQINVNLFFQSVEKFVPSITRESIFIFVSALKQYGRDGKQIGIKGDENKFFQDPTRFTFVAVN